MRIVTVLASVVALVALVVAPVMAQSQPPASSAPATSAPAPSKAPATDKAVEKAKDKEVEGTVKKIDPAAKSVQVSSGLLGLFGATLEVNDQTKINVQGKDGALSDIREGAKVKASYESRDGKNVAKSIDVMPAEEKPKTQ
jgi:Cu/Ag efflux protein CusF